VFWDGDVMIGVCFAVILMTSSTDPTSGYCGSKFYWILGYNTSLILFRKFGHNCGTKNATNPSNPLKTHIIAENPIESNKTLSHEIGSIVEIPQDVDVIQCFDKLGKTSCGFENINKKTTFHTKFFFYSKLQDFPIYRGLEQVPSSMCWRVMAIYNMSIMHPRWALVGLGIFTNFWLLGHNFGSRYARKPIKGSKDLDHSLVSHTTLSHNIGSLDWRPGPGKCGLITQKHTPREPWTQNEKAFYQSYLEDLLNPEMAWTAL